MKMQKWTCETGCGHSFFIDKIYNKHKPVCPNCYHRDTIFKKGTYIIEAEKEYGPIQLTKRGN